MDSILKIVKKQVQGKVPVTVLHLRGWLDAQSEGQLLAAAQEAHDDGARHLLLNLEEVDTLTSAGMRAMQKAYMLFSKGGMKLCSAPPQVYHVLGITGFLQTIPNYETQQAAVDSFEG
jgi:anti-anti-sigma factor